MASKSDKHAALTQLQERVERCGQCALAASRSNAVFGSGNPESRLMFVGEAPGYHEDQEGLPFVGRAGRLLEQLLSRIELTREEVYIANVLKCRPPENRDPLSDEIDLCRAYLDEQISIINPDVICTLGNFSTRLLTGRPEGISRVHGKPFDLPGSTSSTCLYPVFHPAAALYTPANLKALEQDFDRLASILNKKIASPPIGKRTDVVEEPSRPNDDPPDPEQLGLF